MRFSHLLCSVTLLVALVGFVSFAGAQPTGPILELKVHQLTFTDANEIPVAPFTDYGVLEITTLEPGFGEILWVNASVNGEWVIQNQPLIEIDGFQSVQSYSYNFPLPTLPGQPLPQLPIQVEISPLQLMGPPAVPIINLPVQEAFYYPGGVGRDGLPLLPIIPVEPPTIVILPPLPPLWEVAHRAGVPGVDEAVNHCVPGAWARSIAWMNTEYCFELPEDCDSAQELYDSLRTAMGTTTANGTSTIPDNDRTGLQAVVAAKNLGGKVDLVYRPDFQGPAPTPCDLFNALARGCDVVTYVGWLNGAGARTNGHAVTVVGAIKCGETVRIFYKDDASGDDSQGDGQADDGVKTATFEAGGPTGWKLAGMGANQWEGFMALCPKPSAIIDSILKSIFDSFALLPVVSTDDPTDPLLAVILDHAFLIRDNACRLVLHVEDMGATAPPELIELANCLKEMSLEYYFLAQLLFFDPTPETIASMFSLLDPIAAKSSEIDAILDSPTEPEFIRPDCNGDGGLDIADAIALLNFLFGGGTITCEDACDANDDGALNIGDAITILNALFAGGGVPAPTDCGPDPTDDALGCEISPCP